MATSTADWIEELKGISVAELAERIKALEEEFSVSATAVAAADPAAGGGGGDGAAAEEESAAQSERLRVAVARAQADSLSAYVSEERRLSDERRGELARGLEAPSKRRSKVVLLDAPARGLAVSGRLQAEPLGPVQVPVAMAAPHLLLFSRFS